VAGPRLCGGGKFEQHLQLYSVEKTCAVVRFLDFEK